MLFRSTRKLIVGNTDLKNTEINSREHGFEKNRKHGTNDIVWDGVNSNSVTQRNVSRQMWFSGNYVAR